MIAVGFVDVTEGLKPTDLTFTELVGPELARNSSTSTSTEKSSGRNYVGLPVTNAV